MREWGSGGERKINRDMKAIISFVNPKPILYLNNPVMTVDMLFKNFYSCNCMFVYIPTCVYAERYFYICV